MPPGLHAELARAAEREGTSLNGFITARLGEAVGRSQADGAETSRGGEHASRTITWLLVANVVAVALAGAAALAIVLVASLD
jgi:hypothetical protein